MAKRRESIPSSDPRATTEVQTEPGKVLGTPSYMSPEQTRAEALDHRSDLFSLGVVLYQLATGRPPFQGSSFAETVEKITHTQPEAIVRFNYDVSLELERIIRKCLEKRPEDRYQSARELSIDLRRLKRESGTQESSLPQRPCSRTRLAAACAAAVVAIGLLGVWWSRWDAVSSGSLRFGKSVAVLPFKIKAEGREFFAEGLCEELANALGRVEQFDKVPPWSSSSSFRQDTRTKKQMAEEMEVSTILEGSIRKAGDRLRISATLVDPFRGRSGAVMWSEAYDHNQSAALPFAIQDQIARSIAENLRVELGKDQQHGFVHRYTKSPEAYDCYLKGRFFWKRRGQDLRKALRWFELALLFDSPTGEIEHSEMAPAYVGLADTCNMQALYGLGPTRESRKRALRYVPRALKIDGKMAEAYATLGWIRFIDCDLPGATEAFEKAIELDDRLVSARYWYAAMLARIGGDENARKQALKAIEVDPISVSTRTLAAWQLTGLSKPQEALVILKDNPTFVLAHYSMGLALIQIRELDAAIESLETAARLSGQQPFVIAGRARLCVGGRR